MTDAGKRLRGIVRQDNTTYEQGAVTEPFGTRSGRRIRDNLG